MRVHATTAVAAGVAFGLITVFLVRLAVRARHNKSLVGIDALLGQIAIVTKPLEPTGQVMVHGELWEAHSTTPAPRDTPVRVTAVNGLTLTVEPLLHP
jgi:membrane-bound serine protease (ClpP class)